MVKLADKNHTSKGVYKKLVEISTDKERDPDRELTQNAIKNIVKGFNYAVVQNTGNIPGLEAALRNIPDSLLQLSRKWWRIV